MTKDSVRETERWFRTPESVVDELFDFASDECGPLFKLMLYIVRKQNTKTSVHPKSHISIGKGQCIVGRNSGSEALGWKPSTFRDRLEKLEKLGFVELLKVNGHFTLITIVFNKPDRCGDAANPVNNGRKTRKTSRKRRKSDSSPTASRQPPDTSLDARRKDVKKRAAPRLSEIELFASQLDQHTYPGSADCTEEFFNYYEANGWVQGKARAPIKNWQASFRNWVKRSAQYKKGGAPAQSKPKVADISDPDFVYDPNRPELYA